MTFENTEYLRNKKIKKQNEFESKSKSNKSDLLSQSKKSNDKRIISEN